MFSFPYVRRKYHEAEMAKKDAEIAGILREKAVSDSERRNLGRAVVELTKERDALRLDAEKWRARLARDNQRKREVRAMKASA